MNINKIINGYLDYMCKLSNMKTDVIWSPYKACYEVIMYKLLNGLAYAYSEMVDDEVLLLNGMVNIDFLKWFNDRVATAFYKTNHYIIFVK